MQWIVAYEGKAKSIPKYETYNTKDMKGKKPKFITKTINKKHKK
jgi:hypothetical protein